MGGKGWGKGGQRGQGSWNNYGGGGGGGSSWNNSRGGGGGSGNSYNNNSDGSSKSIFNSFQKVCNEMAGMAQVVQVGGLLRQHGIGNINNNTSGTNNNSNANGTQNNDASTNIVNALNGALGNGVVPSPSPAPTTPAPRTPSDCAAGLSPAAFERLLSNSALFKENRDQLSSIEGRMTANEKTTNEINENTRLILSKLGTLGDRGGNERSGSRTPRRDDRGGSSNQNNNNGGSASAGSVFQGAGNRDNVQEDIFGDTVAVEVVQQMRETYPQKKNLPDIDKTLSDNFLKMVSIEPSRIKKLDFTGGPEKPHEYLSKVYPAKSLDQWIRKLSSLGVHDLVTEKLTTKSDVIFTLGMVTNDKWDKVVGHLP